MDQLTKEDWGVIYHELGVAQLGIMTYKNYPSEEYRQERLADLGEVRAKVKQRVRAKHGKRRAV